MPFYIEQNKDYWITKDEGYGNALILKKSWSNNFLDLVLRHKIKIIRLNEFVGWPDSSVLFLLEIPNIHGVDILSKKVTDISPVFQLRQLKTLSIYSKAKIAGDFTAFKCLENLGLSWRDSYESVFGLNTLARVSIIDFPDINLNRWKYNQQLEFLQIESKKLKCLDGMERFPNINCLKIIRCRNLESIDAIKSANFIQKLRIANCASLMDLSPISYLSELKELEIEDCQCIQSIAPITNCQNLELLQIAGNTTILDGNLSGLTRLSKLKKVLLAQRQHYSHTAAELEKTELDTPTIARVAPMKLNARKGEAPQPTPGGLPKY